jgi:protoporphyrinogen oxidase
MTDKNLKIGIIGGGFTGIVTAYLLSKKGYDVTVFEKETTPGGLARTEDFIGTEIERYYHFICKNDHALIGLINETGFKEKLHWQRTSMDYHVRGVLYPFTDPQDLLAFKPLSWWERLRFAISMLPFQVKIDWKKLDSIPNDEWLVKWGGKAVYETIWKPLMLKKYHHRYRDVPAAWVWGRTRRRSKSRDGFPSHEILGYVEGGTPAMIRTMIDHVVKNQGEIRTGSAVQSITPDHDQMAVATCHQTETFDRVISTIPCPVLSTVAGSLPDNYLMKLKQIEYLAVICPVIAVDGKVAREYWTNIFEIEIPYLGVIQFDKLYPDPGYKGLSVSYMPFYVWPDNPLWSSSDDEILDIAVNHLKTMFPWFDRPKIKSGVVFRDRYSQPLIHTGHLKRMLPFATPWEHLFIMDSSMIYPEDRGLNNCIKLAHRLIDRHF